MAKLQTSVDCNCKTCPGAGSGFVCICFCHAHSMKNRKQSRVLNLLGAMSAEMDKVGQLTDDELTTQFAENIGSEERMDSFKCALVGEILHRLKKYSEAQK